MWSGLSVTILRAESDTRKDTLIVAYGEVSAARQADFFVSPSDPAARCAWSTSDHRTAIGDDLVRRSFFSCRYYVHLHVLLLLLMSYPVVTGINCAVVRLCVCAFVQVIAIKLTSFLFGPGCQSGLLRP